MYPRLERFLAALAVAAIVVTAAFWAFPPELRFPEPAPASRITRDLPVSAPVAAAPAPAPPPEEKVAPPVRSEPPARPERPREAAPNPESVIAPALRDKLPEVSFTEEDLRELAETIRTFRDSMRDLRETERTPENADKIRELMARIEENRLRIEKTTGMSINDFLRRMTTEGIDNDRREEGRGAPEPPGSTGR